MRILRIKRVEIYIDSPGAALTLAPLLSMPFINTHSNNEDGGQGFNLVDGYCQLHVLYRERHLNYMIICYHVLFTLQLPCNSINKLGSVFT